MKALVMLVIFAVMSYAAWLRRKEQRGTYRRAADELGLDIDGHDFSGHLGGYDIQTEQVRRRQSRYSKVGAKVLEADLHTAPPDLVLGRESIGSTIARAAGVQDVQVNDREFDGIFRIACDDYGATVSWLNDSRRRTLIELNGLVDAIEISEGVLHIEVPTDPVAVAEIRELLEWFVEVARQIDESPASALPPLNLHVRKRKSKWRPLIAVTLFVLPLVIIAGVFVWFLWTLGAFEERKPREKISVWSDGRGMSVPAGEAFIRCVEETPKSPDLDFAECEKLGLEVNLASRDIRDAYAVMRSMQARRTARVDLDRAAVDETLQDLVKVTEGSSNHSKFVAEYVVPQYWELGLLDRYRELVTVERNDVPPAVMNLDVLHDREGLFDRAPIRDRYFAALRCLADKPAFITYHKGTAELFTACGGRMRYKWRTGRESRLLVATDEVMGVLDAEPVVAADALVQVTPGLLDPELELAWLVYQGTNKREDREREAADPVELAKLLEPVTCLTPWAPEDAFGEPAKLMSAAERAGELGDRLRLYAARQWGLQGQHDKAREALKPITTGVEAICAAQIESAIGSPADALERLESVEDADPQLLALARAQASALGGEWKDAFDAGHEALGELPWPGRDHAAMVIIAAATKLKRDDGLDEALGEVGSVSDLDTHPVSVTRWLGRAARDDRADESDRWTAPDELPLLPGSEVLQYVTAGELAAGKDAELWLDILMPEEFNALNVAGARGLAAELRDDAEAATMWRELEAIYLDRITDPAKARIYRIARRIER